MNDRITVEVTTNYEYVYDETGVDPVNFSQADEDMKNDAAKCAILVFASDGCLCDDYDATDFDTKGPIAEFTSNLQEGVYMYNGPLSANEVSDVLNELGYELE